MDIIAEEISDNPEYRKDIRQKTINFGLLVSKASTEDDSVYRLYYDFAEPIKKLANHRLLAINRGEKEGFLSVKIDIDEEKITNYLFRRLTPKHESPSFSASIKSSEILSILSLGFCARIISASGASPFSFAIVALVRRFGLNGRYISSSSEQVTNTVKLIDDGNTIPFIARYRKEATGSLSDEILRDFSIMYILQKIMFCFEIIL